MRKILTNFWRDEEGQSVVEYSLLMTLIGASMVFMLTLMKVSLSRVIGISDITVQRYAEWAYEKFKTK